MCHAYFPLTTHLCFDSDVTIHYLGSEVLPIPTYKEFRSQVTQTPSDLDSLPSASKVNVLISIPFL